MAYSQAPVQSTYSSHRLPLAQNLEILPTSTTLSPSSSYISGMYNVLPFIKNPGTEEIIGETRNGLFTTAYNIASATGCIVRGMYVWEKTPGSVYYYFVVITDGTNTKVWTSTDTANFTAVNTLSVNGTTPVRFTEFIDATNVKKLVMVDGTDGYVFTANTAGTRITDADFPTPHVPFPVFLDGYLFLAKSGTGDIYNSDLNDPALWTAGSFLSSELYPDDIQALVKLGTYILAIGTQGSEYFYDSGNATGTPLARHEGGTLPFGTVFPNTIACNKDTVILLANNSDGENFFRAVEGFKFVDVEAPAVLSILAAQLIAGTTTGAKLRGVFFRQNGELFYLLNMNGANTGVSTSDSLCYSVKHKMWSELGYGSTAPFPAFFTGVSPSTNTLTFAAGQIANGVAFFAYLNWFDVSGTYGDYINSVNVDIPQSLVVAPQTFGTMNRKFMYRLGVNYIPNSVNLVASVQYSDNVARTYSTAQAIMSSTRSSTLEDTYPFITQLGQFRQRGFLISSTGGKNTWNYIEVDINKGQQ